MACNSPGRLGADGTVLAEARPAIHAPGNKKGRWRGLFMSTVTPQRCRALKRGFDLQITNTLPRRRTTLQSRCRVFAVLRDESTFTAGLLLKVRSWMTAFCLRVQG